VTLAAFWDLHSNGFIKLDDPDYVTANAQVRKGLSAESMAWAFTSTDAANWHPLTWLSHMLDIQLFGMDAGRHHLTSLLLHALNAILLFLLLTRMTGALWRSALVAALFALHPLHVESVAWIAERKDVLSTLFWLLTLFSWLAYVRSKKTTPYILALVLYALGLMAKPMLVTLPFTLLLLDYWPLNRLAFPLRTHSKELKGLWVEKAPFFALSAASCVITMIVQKSGGAVATLTRLPPADRLTNAVWAYAAYLGKTVRPSALAVFYPHPHAGLSMGSTAAAFILLVCTTVFALRLGKRAPYLPFGWLWYLGTLVPVIGLVQVGDQAMADRYTYVPLIGIFIAAVWVLAEIVKGNRALRLAVSAAAAVALAVLFFLTRAQTGYWSGDEALFGRALQITSNNWLVHNQFGLYLFDKGKTKEAIAHYNEAVRINPESPAVQSNLGLALVANRQVEAGIEHYTQALRLKPDAPLISYNLGQALLKMNRFSEAIPCYEWALKFLPALADAHISLGIAFDGVGRTPEALEQFRQALRIKPDSAQALNALGIGLGKMNRLPESIQRLEEAVQRDPDFVDARINLGISLNSADRSAEALEQFRQALRIKPDSVQALDNLGVALLKLNRVPEALERLQQALRTDPNSAEAHFHLGIALIRTQRLEEAQEHFQQALRINPGLTGPRIGLDNIRKALER